MDGEIAKNCGVCWRLQQRVRAKTFKEQRDRAWTGFGACLELRAGVFWRGEKVESGDRKQRGPPLPAQWSERAPT